MTLECIGPRDLQSIYKNNKIVVYNLGHFDLIILQYCHSDFNTVGDMSHKMLIINPVTGNLPLLICLEY